MLWSSGLLGALDLFQSIGGVAAGLWEIPRGTNHRNHFEIGVKNSVSICGHFVADLWSFCGRFVVDYRSITGRREYGTEPTASITTQSMIDRLSVNS